ncbi:cytochrome c peroxidase [Oceanisphaera sp. KMM 10153]|uniref:cytochrome c peroxidase n=1 Tax=Oceanisphaera submarina TaxID=3390193 RepID=UPI0039767846
MATTIFRTSSIAKAVTLVVLATGLSLTSGQAEAKKKDVPVKSDEERVAALVELGKEVFFTPISRPKAKQSCASCHDPATGWTGASSNINLVEVAQPGANIHRDPDARGQLKPPTNAYATFIPPFALATGPGAAFVPAFGGAFWNGRSEGSDPLFPEGATVHISLADVVTVGDPNALTLFEQAVEGFLGPVADQALNPFPNPVEQNIREKSVCQQVKKADYANLFTDAWGSRIQCDQNNYSTSFKRIAVALAAYQDSPEVNSFSSKRDNALRAELACLTEGDIKLLPWAQNLTDAEFDDIVSRFGLVPNDPSLCQADNSPGAFPLAGLTPEENWGHDLFYAAAVLFNPAQPKPILAGDIGTCDADGNSFPGGVVLTEDRMGAGCALCHSNNPGGDDGTEPLQTYADHGYHNIGSPVNFDIPGVVASDDGLADHTGNDGHKGFVKSPSLRNVDLRPSADFIKAYTRNGWFKSLEGLVHFYNTSLVDPSDFVAGPPPVIKHDVLRCMDGEITEQEALDSNCWPEPGHADGVSFAAGITGNLGLSACDEAAIVSYLKTFNDEAVVVVP